jgi:hypothetical protein
MCSPNNGLLLLAIGRLVLAALAIQKNTREVADHFKLATERQEAQSKPRSSSEQERPSLRRFKKTPAHWGGPGLGLSWRWLPHQQQRSQPLHSISSHRFNPSGAWLLTEMGMTNGLQQRFPLSQSLLLIPLTLEGYAGALSSRLASSAIVLRRQSRRGDGWTVMSRPKKFP